MLLFKGSFLSLLFHILLCVLYRHFRIVNPPHGTLEGIIILPISTCSKKVKQFVQGSVVYNYLAHDSTVSFQCSWSFCNTLTLKAVFFNMSQFFYFYLKDHFLNIFFHLRLTTMYYVLVLQSLGAQGNKRWCDLCPRTSTLVWLDLFMYFAISCTFPRLPSPSTHKI